MNISDLLVNNTAQTVLKNNSNIANNNKANSQKTAQTAATNKPLAQALQKAGTRIQTQLDSTSANLSSFGLLKSSLSTTEQAAKSMGALTSSSTDDAVKTTLANFVNAFNASVSKARQTASALGTSVDARSALRTINDLSRAVRADPTAYNALSKFGISLKTDGSLAIDAAKFTKAQAGDPAGLKTALAAVGRQVDMATAKDLSSTGMVTGAVTRLSNQAALLQAQQAALTKVTGSSEAASTATQNMGIAAYQAFDF